MATTINLNTGDLSISNLQNAFDAFEAVKQYKLQLLGEAIPSGEANALRAADICGNYKWSLANLHFQYGTTMFGKAVESTGFYANGNYYTIYRKAIEVITQYANINNPSDIITKKNKVFVYWK